MYTYACKVVNVVDGDTIDILLDLGFEIKMRERVRLIDVDTPEVFGRNAVPEGTKATEFTKKWIDDRSTSGRFVYVSKRYNARDKYGRSLGTLIWTGNDAISESLNDAIVASGNVKK